MNAIVDSLELAFGQRREQLPAEVERLFDAPGLVVS